LSRYTAASKPLYRLMLAASAFADIVRLPYSATVCDIHIYHMRD